MKRFFIFFFVFFFFCGLVCCGDENPVKPDDPNTNENQNEDDKELNSNKKDANDKLDELVNPAKENNNNETLSKEIQTFYNNEKGYINTINNLDESKNAVGKVEEDAKTFVKETLKPTAIKVLNETIDELLENIKHEGLKNAVDEYYDNKINNINNVETIEELVNVFNQIIEDTNNFIKNETAKILIVLKNKALEELDPYVTLLITKIPYEELKNKTLDFYKNTKVKLDNVDTLDGFAPCVEEIKNDLAQFALNETKKIAVTKLNEVITEGLEKLPNQEIKKDLENFKNTQIEKLNKVDKMEDVPSTLESVILETKDHIKELLINTVKDYMKRLLAVENATAYDYLPEAMCATYKNNLVTSSSINYDFTSFVNVSNINKGGYGDQWQMIIENINQSIALAKVFNTVQTALNAATAAIDIYITNSYAETMSHQFSGDNFTGLFEFKNSKLVFNFKMISDINVPIVGNVKPIIKMEYDISKETKVMYISLGDAYKLKYLIADDKYEMATTYGLTVAGKNVSRSSYLSIVKENNKTVGHIYEYTTLEGSDKIKACADFYVEGGYVSVVGNKASGMIAFDSYINELYLASEGKLLGYEIREEKTIAGVTGIYNTLWFNVWDVSGINTLKVTEKTDANKSSRSTVDVYINGAASLLSPTYNTKIIKTSRKYDIELRTRYYYSYDQENNEYVAHEVEIPMLFIQEGDNFTSFNADMKKDNNLDLSIRLNSNHLNKILNDYDTLIDVFITNKENMSSEAINSYLLLHE